MKPPRTRDDLIKEAIKFLADKYGEAIASSIFKPITLTPKKPATGGGGALALVALVVLAGKKRRR